MGFHKRHVPEIEVVKKQYETMSLEDFVNYYAKPDALIGNAESMDFIDKILSEYFQKKANK